MVALSQAEVRGTGTLGVVAVVWFVAAYVAGVAGVFTTDGAAPPLAIGLAAGTPVVGVGVALLVSQRFRAWAASLDAALLINLQAWRVGGFVFLAYYAQGLLPGGFALPAGLGDVAIALAAPFVAAHVLRGGRSARPVFLTWTALGIVDLVLAVTLGVLHSPGPWGILANGGVTTDLVGQFPLSLIPTFGVPFLLVVHLLSLVNPHAGQDGSARVR